MQRVYLDNNATSPLLPEVFDTMGPYFLEKAAVRADGEAARGSRLAERWSRPESRFPSY